MDAETKRILSRVKKFKDKTKADLNVTERQALKDFYNLYEKLTPMNSTHISDLGGFSSFISKKLRLPKDMLIVDRIAIAILQDFMFATDDAVIKGLTKYRVSHDQYEDVLSDSYMYHNNFSTGYVEVTTLYDYSFQFREESIFDLNIIPILKIVQNRLTEVVVDQLT